MNSVNRIKEITFKINQLIEDDNFTEIQKEAIRQKYLSPSKQIDLRKISRQYHKPIKYIKLDIEKADRKLFNLLKNEEVQF